MKMNRKPPNKVTATVLTVLAILGLFLFLRSNPLEKPLLGSNYDKFTRLTQSLKLGMNPTEVEGVLGAPTWTQSFTNGLRWLYHEAESTTGWEYLVEFQNTNGQQRLIYLRNIQHVVFPDSRSFEQGTRLPAPPLPLRLRSRFHEPALEA